MATEDIFPKSLLDTFQAMPFIGMHQHKLAHCHFQERNMRAFSTSDRTLVLNRH